MDKKISFEESEGNLHKIRNLPEKQGGKGQNSEIEELISDRLKDLVGGERGN